LYSCLRIWTVNRILLLFASFGISVILGGLYTGGDQIIYSRVYEKIGSFEIFDAYQYYTKYLTSKEIAHFLVIWTLSNSISKLLLFSLLNTFMSALIIRFFDSLNVNFFVTLTFVLSNFYLYVLFFAAEKLKFGFIIMLLGLLMTFKGKIKNSLIAMSVLGHFQMIIVIAPILFQNMSRSLMHFFLTLRLNRTVLYIVFGILFLLFFVFDHLYARFQAYNRPTNVEDFLRISIFFILTFWYTYRTHSSNNVFLIFIPLFFAIYLLGDDRINMIGYLYFLVAALQYKQGLNFGILISTIYFAVKTIFFIESIVRVGHGFG